MPSPGRTYTITLSESQADELEDFLKSADDGESIIKVLRSQIHAQRPSTQASLRAIAIQAMQETAEDYFQRAASTKSASLRRSWTSDGADVRFIAECLAANTADMDREAKRHTANLDTAVREEIPREAWAFVGLRPLHG